MKYIFTCVNEVGEKYDTFSEVKLALKMLEEFPADFIIVTVKGFTDPKNILDAIQAT